MDYPDEAELQNASEYNMACQTTTNATAPSRETQLLADVSLVIYGYVLPLVCMCGIVGNSLNLAILTRRKLQKSFKALEQAANMCLIALALSDLLFCLFAFPTTFLPKDNLFPNKGFLLYYSIYCTGIINIFILTSTWLTVTMSVERYLAICHPFKQTFFLTIKKTKIIIVIVYIVSVIFNIPVFWRYELSEVSCLNRTNMYKPVKVLLGHSTMFDSIYRVLWAIVGNIAPLILLIGFNICLCRKIHKSYKFRSKFRQDDQHGGQSDAGHTLTITLVVIVVMFLILVAPTEVVMHAGQLSPNINTETFKTIEVILNFMQSVNFSLNFALYCIISPYFRRTLKYLLCCRWYFGRKQNYYLEVSMKKVTFSTYSKKSTL